LPTNRVLDWLTLDAGYVLGLLLLVSLLCRAVWLWWPTATLATEETITVNAARVLLDWPVPEGAPYADEQGGLDPDRERPPLGKVLLATSMAIFGDGPFGWRVPSLAAGVASIGLVWGIAHTLARDAWLGLLAATLFAFDNLALVHSRIGSLDMPLVALMLLAAWCAVRRMPFAAGVSCAAAALIEPRGASALVALVLLELADPPGSSPSTATWRHAALPAIGRLLMGFLPVWLGAWWLLDLAVSVYPAPWDHLRYIIESGWWLTASGDSYPWQWLINQVQTLYLRVDQQLFVDNQVVRSDWLIYLRSAMNPVIIGAAPLALMYTLWRAWRHGDRLARWVVAWTMVTYLPFFLPAVMAQQPAHLVDFLPTLPAITLAVAQLLRQAGLPQTVTYGYLFAVLAGFIGYFPFHIPPYG
jgi:predicted membrane-bound dolichyl-phosphate-mannose-protein mannosyltransferase